MTLSLQWTGSLLWHRFDSWLRNFCILEVQTKKKARENLTRKALNICNLRLSVVAPVFPFGRRFRERKLGSEEKELSLDSSFIYYL